MALNFGLGYLFKGKDAGLRKQQLGTRKEFGLLGGVVEKLNRSLADNSLSRFVTSVSIDQIGKIKGALDSVVGAGGELTTSWEAQMVQYHKTAKTISAELGGTEKDHNKRVSGMTSMAIKLNRSVEAVGATWTAAAKTISADTLKSVGGVEELVKAEDSMGIASGDLTTTIGFLEKRFKLSGSASREFLDSIASIGSMTDTGTSSIRAMVNITRDVGDAFAAFAKENPDEALRVIRSTTALAASFQMMGKSEGDATSSATTLMKTMVEQRTSMEGLFAGMGDDIPKFTEELTIAFGNVGMQFDKIQQDPLKFALGLAKMRQAGLKTTKGIEFPFNRMTKVLANFDPALAKLAESMDENMIKKMEEVAQVVQDPKKGLAGAFKETTKRAFSTGRTVAEKMAWIQDQFVARVRQATDANNSLVSRAGKAYGAMGDKLKKLAKKDGPLGAVVRKMIDMHQIGTKALLPEALWPMADVMGKLSSETAPAITALGSMGLRFSMLLNPVTLVVGAVAGLVYWFGSVREEGELIGTTLERMSSQFGGFIGGIPEMIDHALASIVTLVSGFGKEGGIDWNTITTEMFRKFKASWEVHGPDIMKSLGKIGDFILQGLIKVGKAIPGFMKETVLPGLLKLADVLLAGLKWVLPKLGQLFTGLGSWLAENLPGITKTTLNFLWDLGAKIIKALPDILKGLKVAVLGAIDLFMGVAKGLFEGIRDFLVEKFPSLAGPVKGFFNFIIEYYTIVADGWKWFFGLVTDGLASLFDFFTDDTNSMSEVWHGFVMTLGEWWDDIWASMKKTFLDTLDGLPAPFKLIFDGLKLVVTSAVDAMGSAFSGVKEQFMAPFKAVEWIVDKVHGHLVHKTVEEDMSKAVEVMEKSTKKMRTSMSSIAVPMGITPPTVPGKSTAGLARAATTPAQPMAADLSAKMAARLDTSSLVDATNHPAWYQDLKRTILPIIAGISVKPDKEKTQTQTTTKRGPSKQPPAREIGLSAALVGGRSGAPARP